MISPEDCEIEVSTDTQTDNTIETKEQNIDPKVISASLRRFCSRIDNLQESINSEREANCPMFDREFRTRINNWAQRLDNLDNLHTFADSELRELRSIADDLAALFDNYAEYFESINELSTMEMRLQRLRGELRTNEMHLREEVWNGIYFLGSVTLGVVTVGAFVKYYRKNLMNIIQYGLKNMKK